MKTAGGGSGNPLRILDSKNPHMQAVIGAPPCRITWMRDHGRL
jgi:hypothetical protein